MSGWRFRCPCPTAHAALKPMFLAPLRRRHGTIGARKKRLQRPLRERGARVRRLFRITALPRRRAGAEVLASRRRQVRNQMASDQIMTALGRAIAASGATSRHPFEAGFRVGREVGGRQRAMKLAAYLHQQHPRDRLEANCRLGGCRSRTASGLGPDLDGFRASLPRNALGSTPRSSARGRPVRQPYVSQPLKVADLVLRLPPAMGRAAQEPLWPRMAKLRLYGDAFQLPQPRWPQMKSRSRPRPPTQNKPDAEPHRHLPFPDWIALQTQEDG